MSKRKIATVVLTTVALTAGSLGVANAASKTSRTVVTKSVTKVSQSGANARGLGGPAAALDSLLSGLVTKGTITQIQADAIKAAVVAAAETAKANRPAKAMGPNRAAMDALISSTLGIDSATIKSRLKAGETLAAIAGSKKDALIAALVTEHSKKIDARVTAGKITAAQATTLKAALLAHVTEEINEVKGKQGHGGPMGAPAPLGTPTNYIFVSPPYG
jgi:polyhydroxyalkanoate synthesis regulator phasin